jgi:hypothetical protein
MLNRIRSAGNWKWPATIVWTHLVMSGQCPDHATIAGFVSKHGKRLGELFKDVLQVALRAGLVKLEHVAVDGTKIEADAGKGSVHGEESIRSYRAKVDEQVAKLEAEWAANESESEPAGCGGALDAEEGPAHGSPSFGDETEAGTVEPGVGEHRASAEGKRRGWGQGSQGDFLGDGPGQPGDAG